MTRRQLAALVPIPWARPSRPAIEQTRYVDGVFVHNGEQPIELLAYATRTGSGALRLAAASLDDIPTLHRVHRVLCSQPSWKPAGVWASTMDIFGNDRASRQQLRFGVRQINIYTMELRIPDVEDEVSVARLAGRLGASEDNPLIVLVTQQSELMTRDYVVRLVR